MAKARRRWRALQGKYDGLLEEYEGDEDVPDDADARLEELEAEIERLSEGKYAYDAVTVGRGGVYVSIARGRQAADRARVHPARGRSAARDARRRQARRRAPGPDSTETPEMTGTPGTGTDATPETSDSEATVSVSEEGDLAPYLVGPEGLTLYTFANDEPGTSNCDTDCLENWPPLTVEGGAEPTAGEGVSGELDVIEHEDGTMQVTYNDQPLYYYAGDEAPGDTNGHEVGDVWFVAEPTS